MRNRVRGVVAMEEEEIRVAEAEAAVVPVEEVAMDNAESVETEMLEVAEIVAETEETQADIKEAAEVVEALESIAETLKLSVANGGMDKHSAAIVGISTQHMYGRVGLRANSMPALESFGGTSTRIGATKLALEDIKERAKKIWDSIVAMFTKAIQLANDFYTKMFVSWEKIETRAGELAKKSGNAKGDVKIDSSSLIEKLAIDGKVPSMGAALGKFKTFAENTLGQGSKIDAYYDKLVKSVDESTPDAAITAKFTVTSFASNLEGFKEASGKEAKAGLTVFTSEEQFGGFALEAAVPKAELTGKEAATAVAGISFHMAKSDAKVAVKEMASLSSAEVTEVTKTVAEVAKIGLAYKAVLSSLEAKKKKMIGIAKKLSGKEEADSSTRAVVISLATNIDQPGAAVTAYALRTSKALLDYVELSVKADKKAEEPAAA